MDIWGTSQVCTVFTVVLNACAEKFPLKLYINIHFSKLNTALQTTRSVEFKQFAIHCCVSVTLDPELGLNRFFLNISSGKY